MSWFRLRIGGFSSLLIGIGILQADHAADSRKDVRTGARLEEKTFVTGRLRQRPHLEIVVRRDSETSTYDEVIIISVIRRSDFSYFALCTDGDISQA